MAEIAERGLHLYIFDPNVCVTCTSGFEDSGLRITSTISPAATCASVRVSSFVFESRCSSHLYEGVREEEMRCCCEYRVRDQVEASPYRTTSLLEVGTIPDQLKETRT